MLSPMGAVVMSKTEFRHGARRKHLEVADSGLLACLHCVNFEHIDQKAGHVD